MNFAAYIQKQKWGIRSRHEGETYLICANEAVAVRPTEEILAELENLKGLNKEERLGYVNIRRTRVTA